MPSAAYGLHKAIMGETSSTARTSQSRPIAPKPAGLVFLRCAPGDGPAPVDSKSGRMNPPFVADLLPMPPPEENPVPRFHLER